MSYLEWLENSLTDKLEEQPVGEPVALRAYLELSEDHGHLVPTAGAMAAVAGAWFGAGLPKVYALGGAGQGYVSVTATYPGGQTALIVDDLAAGGGSLVDTATRLRSAGVLVRDAMVLVDRQQGAASRLEGLGVRLHSALTLEVLLTHLQGEGRISHEDYRSAIEYLHRVGDLRSEFDG